jgi:hypothetical protein
LKPFIFSRFVCRNLFGRKADSGGRYYLIDSIYVPFAKKCCPDSFSVTGWVYETVAQNVAQLIFWSNSMLNINLGKK